MVTECDVEDDGVRERPATLGEYIWRRRRAAGLTMAELAAMVGTAPSNISRIENSRTATPTAELMQRLADALDLDLAELFSYRGITLQRPCKADLPTLLRTRYELPDEAIAEMVDAIERVVVKYRRDGSRELKRGR